MQPQAVISSQRVPILALLSFVLCAAALYAHPVNAAGTHASAPVASMGRSMN